MGEMPITFKCCSYGEILVIDRKINLDDIIDQMIICHEGGFQRNEYPIFDFPHMMILKSQGRIKHHLVSGRCVEGGMKSWPTSLIRGISFDNKPVSPIPHLEFGAIRICLGSKTMWKMS